MLCCGWLVFNSCDWCFSILTVLVGCSLRGPRFHNSSVIVFLDSGHPCFWNFSSTLPFVGWSLMWITSLTLPVYFYLVPKWIVSSVEGVLWNGRGLGMGKSHVSVMLLYPVFHRSSVLLVHPCICAVTTISHCLFCLLKRSISRETLKCSFRYLKVEFKDIWTHSTHIWEQSAQNNPLYRLNFHTLSSSHNVIDKVKFVI